MKRIKLSDAMCKDNLVSIPFQVITSNITRDIISNNDMWRKYIIIEGIEYINEKEEVIHIVGYKAFVDSILTFHNLDSDKKYITHASSGLYYVNSTMKKGDKCKLLKGDKIELYCL